MKKVPFYFALTTCILVKTSLFFLSSAIATGIYLNTTNGNIEFLKSEISFRKFVLGENARQYQKDYVKNHFENNLNPVQLKQVASKHWSYKIKANDTTTTTNELYIKTPTLKLQIIQEQQASLLDEKFHNQGSITGGDNTDSITSHINIKSTHKYTLTTGTEVHRDENTGELTLITTYTYEFEIEKIEETKDESITVPNPIEISYSPVFLEIGLTEGEFIEKIHLTP